MDGLNSATANTVSTIVARDASGNFSAGTITAALTGNATTATSVGNLTGIATVAPLAAGTAAVGTSTLGARQDHVHPAQTTLSSGTLSGTTTIASARVKDWTSSDTSIDGLISGTVNGVLFEGPQSAHFTVGLRSNDVGDGFQVISKGTSATPLDTDPYTTLCFEVKANGNVTWAGTATGALTGAASSNVLKAGDTMTGALNISTGGGVASSSKHINLVNGTGYELFLIPRAAGGAYNGLTAAGDSLIAFTTGTQDTGALVIGPWSATAKGIRIDSSGNVGIGATSTTYKLQVVGSFAATTKSFVIPHPTKEGKQLRYGSLEGPENGVYVRGRLKDNDTIELPEYWTGLVDEDSITINLTPIGKHQKLYVESIKNNIVIIGNENLLNKSIDCFYIVFAERKDVEKLKVEI